jgi:predicted nucleic acid-binding protein
MKILVDTSVWSLALRRNPGQIGLEQRRVTQRLAEFIQNGQVEIIGPVRQEILSGLRHENQFEKLKDSLRAFPDNPLDTPDYEEAARCYNFCRSKGVQCGPIDILICALAKRRQWRLFSTDSALNACARTLGIDLVETC